MLFNSYLYIFIYLPVVFSGYFLLTRWRFVWGSRAWLVFASLYFYGHWNFRHLPLILGSMVFNYWVGNLLANSGRGQGQKRNILIGGIFLNFGLLGYYKYYDFFAENLNALTGSNFELIHVILPLAVSFFTFQQVAYLVDSYNGHTSEYDFSNYCLFVSFFPQLIAGPIVHHKEMMPQFTKLRNVVVNWKNVGKGLMLFSVGFFKKAVIADTLAEWVGPGFDQAVHLDFLAAWVTSLCYTFQLYFDFSGYTDMAIGSALLFNIQLPWNFNSPYKALNIQDFWRRWHMTLSRWLRDYLYIPLGGNRKGRLRTYLNLFMTFLLGGLWHGAGWTFIAWGAMHGVGMSVHKFWSGRGWRMPVFPAWLLTFLFVHCSWVFFRAGSFADAMRVFKGMMGINGLVLPLSSTMNLSDNLAGWLRSGDLLATIDGKLATLIWVFVVGGLTIAAKNSNMLNQQFRPCRKYLVFAVFLFFMGVLHLNKISKFLYFNF